MDFGKTGDSVHHLLIHTMHTATSKMVLSQARNDYSPKLFDALVIGDAGSKLERFCGAINQYKRLKRE